MDVMPEMRDLRDGLDGLGIHWESDDSEEITDEWTEAVLHIERTRVADICVSYMWIRDDDGKRFLSTHGKYGYLETEFPTGERVAMTAGEVIDVLCTRTRGWRESESQRS